MKSKKVNPTKEVSKTLIEVKNVVKEFGKNKKKVVALKEGVVYKYVSGKGLVKNNQLRIQDNMLYTCNVGTKLKTYPQYGWSSKDSSSHCTATLGGISMITLKNGSSYNI